MIESQRIVDLRIADLPRGRHRFDVAVPDSEGPGLPVEVLVGDALHPCLGLVAGVHGDEYEGMLALWQVVRELDPRDLQGTLLVIPVANPYAFAAGQRRTPEDDADLNRVFPGKAQGSLSERLAALICQRLLVQTDAIFTLHGSSANGVLSPWVEFLDLPNAVGRASYALARASGFSDLIALPRLPGVLLTAMGDLGVPLIEGEVGGRGTSQQANIDLYWARVTRVARYVGVLRETARSVLPPYGEPRRARAVWRLTSVAAEVGGMFLRQVDLRQAVRQGDLLGRILDLHGEAIAELRAPADGVVGGYVDHLGVHAGQNLFSLWIPAGRLKVD